MRAEAVIDRVGTAMHDPDPAVVDPERVRADLRHDGGETLAERGAAGEQLDRARRVHPDAHPVGRARPALLDEQREPRPGKLGRPRGGRAIAAWIPSQPARESALSSSFA